METEKLMDLVKNIRDDERQKIFEDGYDLGLKIGKIVAHDDQPEEFDPDSLSEDERAFYDKGYDDGWEQGWAHLDYKGTKNTSQMESEEDQYAKGYDAGYEDGYANLAPNGGHMEDKGSSIKSKPDAHIDEYSYEQGYEDGFNTGSDEGYDEGYEEGLKDGGNGYEPLPKPEKNVDTKSSCCK